MCGSENAGSPEDNSIVENWGSCAGSMELQRSWGSRLQGPPRPDVLTPPSVTLLALWPCTRLARRLCLPGLLQVPAIQANRGSAIEGGCGTGGLVPVRKRRLLRDVLGDNEQPFKVSYHSSLLCVGYCPRPLFISFPSFASPPPLARFLFFMLI